MYVCRPSLDVHDASSLGELPGAGMVEASAVFNERQWAVIIVAIFCLISVAIAVIVQMFVDSGDTRPPPTQP
jgi:hypothetical protein